MAQNQPLDQLHAVFSIEHGNKFDLNKMELCAGTDENAVAFVGRSGEKNGIVAFVKPKIGVAPFAAGLITVALGGAALSSFVQPKKFYTAQNIDVLTPRQEMTLEQKIYYCLCLEANRFRYSTFGREANRTLKNILVPKAESVPSWTLNLASTAVQELSRDLAQVIDSPLTAP